MESEQTPDPNENPNPETPPAPPEAKPNTDEILREISNKLDKRDTPPAPPQPTGPTREEIRARVKERTGFTDEQLDYAEQMAVGAVNSAVAPLQEKIAWSELREEIGKIDPSIEAAMREELKQYPVNLRGDKVLLEKVYDMTVGRLSRKAPTNGSPKIPPVAPTKETPPTPREDLVDRRIVTNNPGSSPSLTGGGSPSKTKLSEDEQRTARRFGMTDEEYIAHKNNTDITSLKKKPNG